MLKHGILVFGAALGLGVILSGHADPLYFEDAGLLSSVKFRMQNDRINLEITQTLPLSASVDDARAIFSDVSLIPQVSDIIVEAKVVAVASGYRVETKAVKSLAGIKVSATMVNQCVETETNGSWERSCRMITDRTGKDTGKYVHEGSQLIRCVEDAASAQVTCTHHIFVRPKPVSYWPVFKRNAQQMGSAGAQESVHDMTVMAIMASSHATVAAAKARFAGSVMERLNERMYTEARALADSGELGSLALTIEISEAGETFRKVITEEKVE